MPCCQAELRARCLGAASCGINGGKSIPVAQNTAVPAPVPCLLWTGTQDPSECVWGLSSHGQDPLSEQGLLQQLGRGVWGGMVPRRRAASRVWLRKEPPACPRSAGGRRGRGEKRERNRREGRRRGEREGGGRRGSLSSRPRAGPGSTLPSPLCSSPRRQGAKA